MTDEILSDQTNAPSLQNSVEQRWYTVCHDYFRKGENKSAIEWFQQVDQATDATGDQSPAALSNSLTAEEIDFYKQCGIFSFASREEWYQHDVIKNDARSAAHLDMSRDRLAVVVHECLSIDVNFDKSTTNSAVLSHLNRFLSLPAVQNTPIVWTLLDHMCLWIDRYLYFITKLISRLLLFYGPLTICDPPLTFPAFPFV